VWAEELAEFVLEALCRSLVEVVLEVRPDVWSEVLVEALG